MQSLLLSHEIKWVQQYDFLEKSGYRLRPRYQPGWVPSWNTNPNNSLLRLKAEDNIRSKFPDVLDATRIRDGAQVVLKRVRTTTQELKIGLWLSAEGLRDLPQNHCVPHLESLHDPSDPDHAILVFPLLRRLDMSPFVTIAECIDFVEQTLEGLAFMHEHEVAHRDCTMHNIMMDGRRMFPEGFHPMMPYLTRDGSRILGNGLTRTEAGGVRYFFIDFGISTMGPKFVFGLDGQERAPELTDGDNVPYDPFKLDVYILGMAYRAAFMTEHRGAEVILPLVEAMTAENPAERPTAAECVDRFKTMRSGCSTHFLKGFLRSYNPDTENVVTTFLLDWINKIANFWTEGLPEADPIPPLESFWK